MTPWDALLGALATYRLTRLVVSDGITEPLREWVWRRTGRTGPWFAALIGCGWCVSIWAAGGVVLAWWAIDPVVWQVGCAALGWSAAAGFLSLIDGGE